MSADTTPTSSERLRCLTADIDKLAALPPTSYDCEVESCPGWSIAELLVHLGRVQHWVVASMASGPGENLPPFPPRPATQGDELADWFLRSARQLVAVLGAADLDALHSTWAGDRSGHWWVRRQAFEHAVHRWDAETAAGLDASPIAFPADGVDEWAELQDMKAWQPPAGLHGTVHLHGTDGDGEWLFAVDESLTVTHGHHKGDAAIRGTLSDLCLLLWGRRSIDRFEIHGDAAFAARLIASL